MLCDCSVIALVMNGFLMPVVKPRQSKVITYEQWQQTLVPQWTNQSFKQKRKRHQARRNM